MIQDLLSIHASDWQRQYPERVLALPYLDPARRDALVAYAAIAGQWQDDVDGIRETAVLEAKFAWWAEELALSRRGESRHPLSKALFQLPAASDLPEALWLAPLEAGLARREAPPVADFAAQMAAFEPFQRALARLETALWFASAADATRATRVGVLGHIAAILPRIGHANAGDVLPMNLLARHGLSLDGLAETTPARTAALRDQLQTLQSAAFDAISLPGPLSLFASASWRASRQRLARALRAADPVVELATAIRPGFRLAWQVWRDARRLRRHYRF